MAVIIGAVTALWSTAAAPSGAAAAPAGATPAMSASVTSGPAPGWDIRAASAGPALLVRDTGPPRRTKRGLPAPAMSPQMLSANAERQLRAREFLRRLRQNVSVDIKCTSRRCRRGLPAARNLGPTQQAQARGYYCGPAMVSEMLAQLGQEVSQRSAARELHTNPGGTNWSDDSGYPVPRVLNMNQKKNNYVAVALPWSPTSRQVATFQTDLVADVNHNGGVPLAGNAYEVAGGPHLAGHPVNQTIFHWFDIRGYKDFGAVTNYEDSVHGASSIGWSSAVPAYSSMASSTIVAILGARGYDW